MGRNTKFSTNIKIDAVRDYLDGKKSQSQIAKDLNIHLSTIQGWISSYKALGVSGLNTTPKNIGYPSYLKEEAVRLYLSGNLSQYEVCEKYGIRCRSQLRKWILRYNSHKDFKSSKTKECSFMTKGRTTTFEEKIEIVKYCIEHSINYTQTAEKYKVSYQQVYTWTAKYKECGIEALVDRRGKRKNPEDMSKTEKLAAQVKLLEAENKRLQMENGFLKKLKEVERRRDGKTNI